MVITALLVLFITVGCSRDACAALVAPVNLGSPLDSDTVGGSLKRLILPQENVLEYRARTKDGQSISDQVTFTTVYVIW